MKISMKRYSRNSAASVMFYSASIVMRLSHEVEHTSTSARSSAACPEPTKGAAALVCCNISIGYSEKPQGHSPCEHMQRSGVLIGMDR